MPYNVILEGTGQKGSNHAGIRTWTSLASADNFPAWSENHKHSIILAHGVSDEEAVALVQKTTMAAYVASAIKEAGEDRNVLALKLANISFLAQREERRVELASALQEALGDLLNVPKL